MFFRKQSEQVFSPLRNLEHVAFCMNGFPEFICLAGFNLHRIVADGAEQVVRHLRVSLLTESSSGPGDEGHWFSFQIFVIPFLQQLACQKDNGWVFTEI